MENKKKIFAIVLFLLLGLITFTFANPSENEKLDDDGKGTQTEKTGKDSSKSTTDNKTTNDTTTTTNDNDNTTDDNNTTGTNNGGTNAVVNTGNNAQANTAGGNTTGDTTDNNGNNTTTDTNNNNDNNKTTDNNNNDDEAKKAEEAAKAIAAANEAAEKAVQKAEDSYKNDDYEAAKELVSNLTDENKKSELEGRLEDVKKTLDVIALVDELENKTNESTNKDELDAARDYRTDEDIANKVESLTDEDLKAELTARLEELAKILDDTTPATIEGIENGIVTNEDVTLTVTDDNEFTYVLYVNGEEVEYTLGEAIITEGNYKLVVTDAAFNTSEITFTVDKTAPKVNFGNGKITDEAFTIEVTDDNFDYMTIWNNKTGETVKITENTYTLPDAAEDNVRYKVTAYDKAGNVTPVSGKDQSIYHDNVKPVITLNGEETVNTVYNSVRLNVSDGSLKKVVITKGEDTKEETFDNNYTIKKVTYEVELTEEGTHTVKATDRQGNETEVTFTIDATAPTLTVKDGEEFTKGQNGTYSLVSFKLYDANKVKEVEINGKVFTLTESNWSDVNYIKPGSWNAVEGENTITLRDAAGNETTQTFVLDTTAPTYVNLGILNKDNYPNKGSLEYAKTGSNIRVLVSFKEKLAVEPTVTINGKEFKATFRPQSSSETTFFYMVDHKITEEDNFAEGELQIKVYGYADEAGNVGEELTNSNITYKKYPRVIYDVTAPTLTVKDESKVENGVYTSISFKLFDKYKVKEVEVNGVVKSLTAAVWSDANDIAVGKNGGVKGENTIILRDLAGNETSFTFTLESEEDKAAREAAEKAKQEAAEKLAKVIEDLKKTIEDAESYLENDCTDANKDALAKAIAEAEALVTKYENEEEVAINDVATADQNIKDVIERDQKAKSDAEEAAKKALEDAEEAVDNAEKSKDDKDIKDAEEKVGNLPNGEDKDELQARLDYLKALVAVEKAEETNAKADVNTARELVNKLTNEEQKKALNDRLDAVQAIINATAAVVNAETTKTQADVYAARELVKNLPEGKVKTDLTNRLDAIQTEIDAKKAAEEAAKKALEDAIQNLQAKITEGGTYLTDNNEYTEETETALQNAVNAGQKIVNSYPSTKPTLESINNAINAIDEAIDNLAVTQGTIEKDDVKVTFTRHWKFPLNLTYDITVTGDISNVQIATGNYSAKNFPASAKTYATSAGTFNHDGDWLSTYTLKITQTDGTVVYAHYTCWALSSN